MRLLAIHAHPDDVEFQCSGTLMLLVDAGHEVVVASMTPGDKGSAELGPIEIGRVRRAEATAAAKIIGAEYHCLEFRDLEITHDNSSRRRVVEFIRTIRPDVLITAPPIDYMADHEITSRLVRDAAFNASVPNYDAGVFGAATPTDKPPYLIYVDSVDGIDYYGRRQNPDFWVDVESVYERKRKVVACHASQRNWLMRQHGIDEYMLTVERWDRQRGDEVGCRFAESFKQHVGHPHPHDFIIEKLLGDRVKRTKKSS